MLTVSHVMTANPVLADVDMSVQACADLLHEKQVRHLPLVDSRGLFIGMLTDTNVIPARSSQASLVNLTVPIGTVDPLDPISKALKQLLGFQLEVAVVLDQTGRPIGIFTTKDVLKLMHAGLPETVLARSIATRPVRAIAPQRRAVAALAILFEEQIHHLLVCSPTAVVGVLSYRDLAFRDATVLSALSVGQLVEGRQVISCPADYSLKDAVGVMIEHGVGCIPLIEPDGSVDGLVTRTDVAKALLEEVRGLERAARKSKLVKSK
jgi:CBS domain-containing protein